MECPDPLLDSYLKEIGIESVRIDDALDEAALIKCLRATPFHLIFKRSRTPITRSVLEAGEHLHGIMLCCVGDDSVDKQAAADHGVLVQNDPISNGRSVVELVMGELVVLARRLFQAHSETSSHRFIKQNTQRYELAGRTLGVYGLGNIGKQVAQQASNFGMEILFFDTREVAVEVGEAMGWRSVDSPDELFSLSNAVTLHISAEDEQGLSNEHVLGYQQFSLLGSALGKGPKLFINAGRGFLYPPNDLIRAVKDGHIESAFVDVFPDEPRNALESWRNPYADTPEIFTTPHIGAATQEAQPRIARHMALTTKLRNERGSVRDCVFRPGRAIQAGGSPGDTVLAVVHSDRRGTKKAIDDTIYEAGASNLGSSHRDFPRYGIAYDVNVLDQPLSHEQLDELVERAITLTGVEHPIRSLRQFQVPKP